MNYYDPNYFSNQTNVARATNAISGQIIWTIIALVLAVVGGIVLYFTIFNQKNEGKYKGVMAVLYDLVHFRYFVIDDLFRILYIISVLAITLLSFSFIGKWQFLVLLIGGNLGLRISYELMMLFLGLCHDVRNLSNKKRKD